MAAKKRPRSRPQNLTTIESVAPAALKPPTLVSEASGVYVRIPAELIPESLKPLIAGHIERSGAFVAMLGDLFRQVGACAEALAHEREEFERTKRRFRGR